LRRTPAAAHRSGGGRKEGSVKDWAESDLEVANGRLHLYRRGAGRPVILAHGATDNGRCWSRVAAALEDRFEFVAYDARGHGRSSEIIEGRPHGEDLVAVAEGLGLDSPAAMGHSMGAGAVSEAISMRPELFAAAVLEDPGWGMPPQRTTEGGRERLRTLTGWVESLQRLSLEEIVAEGRKQNPTWHEDELEDWAEAKLQYRPGPWPTRRSDWRELVQAFACPVLLVCGTPGNAIVSAETATEAAHLNQRVQVVSFEAGHNIRREAFDGYVAEVGSFLASSLS
jgi:N-formylmaleamate deformylase